MKNAIMTPVCPVCASSDVTAFWEITGVPVQCNVLCDTREEALSAPRGDIRLEVCGGCGFVFNAAFDPARVAYDQTYENSLHYSPRFRDYADGLVRRLTETHALRGKQIVEIACGQGDFLKALCAAGGNHGVGFDPSCDPQATEVPDGSVCFVQDYFGEQHAGQPADFICCRHALEHIPDPVPFLRMIRRNLGDRRDVVLYFEVPNMLYTLRDMGIWDILYEHCNYFCAASLSRCFAAAGFDILDVHEAYGGQFLGIEARPYQPDEASQGGPDDPSEVNELARAFGRRFEAKLADWKERTTAWSRAGQRAVVWGSGTKGVMFLNILGSEAPTDRVVDINPRKQGRFVVGVGLPIVAPEQLPAQSPDQVIVMNPLYVDEISATLKGLGLTPRVVTA